MFVQIIEGRTQDADGVRRQHDRWLQELRPGATGFLGATAGVTADGRTINIARFESEELARANSDRPEQGQWWAETEKYFDGEVRFTESTDVTEWRGGGSNDAGFVQVMKSSGIDRARMDAFDAKLEPLAELRPDLIGGIRIWTGPDACTEAIYFTSEAEARAGESQEQPEEMRAVFEEFGDLMEGVDYLDLTDPWLV